MLSALNRSAPRLLVPAISNASTKTPFRRLSTIASARRYVSPARLACTPTSRGFRSAPPRASMNAAEYSKLSDETMETLYEALDNWCEANDGVDVDYSSGVLTLTTPKGTYVVNKQPPNKQIWLSSPVSGPFQYAFNAEIDEWVDIRGSGDTLKALVGREVGEGLL